MNFKCSWLTKIRHRAPKARRGVVIRCHQGACLEVLASRSLPGGCPEGTCIGPSRPISADNRRRSQTPAWFFSEKNPLFFSTSFFLTPKPHFSWFWTTFWTLLEHFPWFFDPRIDLRTLSFIDRHHLWKNLLSVAIPLKHLGSSCSTFFLFFHFLRP